MSLWSEIESITRTMDAINEKNGRLLPKSPISRMKQIQSGLFKNGLNYVEARYIIDVAMQLDVECSLSHSDFHGSPSMMYNLAADNLIDTLIIRMEQIKK